MSAVTVDDVASGSVVLCLNTVSHGECRTVTESDAAL